MQKQRCSRRLKAIATFGCKTARRGSGPASDAIWPTRALCCAMLARVAWPLLRGAYTVDTNHHRSPLAARPSRHRKSPPPPRPRGRRADFAFDRPAPTRARPAAPPSARPARVQRAPPSPLSPHRGPIRIKARRTRTFRPHFFVSSITPQHPTMPRGKVGGAKVGGPAPAEKSPAAKKPAEKAPKKKVGVLCVVFVRQIYVMCIFVLCCSFLSSVCSLHFRTCCWHL